MKYPAYPKVKDSGVPWLGEVPEHWEIWKLAHGFKNTGSGTTPPTDGGDWYEGDIPWVTTSELRESVITETSKMVSNDAIKNFSALKVFPKGSLAIAMYGATIGRLGILGIAATTNQACCVLSGERTLHTRFMFYWFQSFREQIVLLASGGGQPNISQEKIRSIKVACSSLEEQTAIAHFLDRETERIDALIEKKRTLIALLEEKRSALISRTVTRGLPADVAKAYGLEPHTQFKDSGVEWLGEIPKHWEIKRGRFCMAVNPASPQLRTLSPKDEISFVPMDAVGEYGGLRLDQERAIEEVGSGYTEFQNGDVVVAKITPCFENGKGALAFELKNSAAYGTTELHVLRALANLNRNFLFYLTISDNFRKIGESEMYGAGGQKRVPPEFCKDFRTPLPTIAEQTAIANYLDRETAKLDQLKAKVDTAIERLQEYRSALITAAVTGKIDVRQAA